MLLSASNLSRFSLCPSSVLLPRTPSTASASSQKGTNIHDFVSKCITEGEEEARKAMPERYQGKAVVGRIAYPELVADLVDIRSEIAVYWRVGDLETPDQYLILGENIGRNYYQLGAEDYNYVGSIDILAKNAVTGNWVVADIKTGMQEIEAAESEQLQLLAYIISQIFQVSTVETRIIKVYDNGSSCTSSHIVASTERLLIERRLKAIHARIKENLREYAGGRATEFFAGDSTCKYCACKDVCPAYAEFIKCQSISEEEAVTKQI